MIFVDSWAWIALAARGDREHTKAQEQHRRFVQANRQYVTTDFVLSEVITNIYRLHPASEAQSYVSAILDSTNAGTYQLVHVSPQQFYRSWIMRQRYKDKPDISFVDFTSFVIMQELGITDVLTGDAHFRDVNLGFHLFP